MRFLFYQMTWPCFPGFLGEIEFEIILILCLFILFGEFRMFWLLKIENLVCSFQWNIITGGIMKRNSVLIFFIIQTLRNTYSNKWLL